ncbi:MAG: hypothetical protein FWG83_01145 [Oscillospiraceae bacterium]|nr:hypothetical protein [Oscillospiraceae bacterium]
MKKLLRKKIIIPTVAVLTAVVILTVTFVNALWDERRAVHIKAADIENSTLAIGSHLIHLSGLSENLYDIAYDSAMESGQDRIYYKSELMGGVWCDITTATTISAIAEAFEGESMPVMDSVIEGLFFTHHTKSDGITYDLRTNRPVNIFDIRDPYELELLEELFPLKTQFDLYLENQSESDEGKKKIERLEEFFQTDVTNGITDRCDNELSSLQAYYSAMAPRSENPEKNAVQSVMDSVDATRREQVFSILEQELLDFAEELQTMQDTEATEESEGESASSPDMALVAAVNESLANVQSTLILHQGRMMSEGESVSSTVYFRFATNLIRAANANNYTDCDTAVQNLVDLDRILSDQIINRESEFVVLRDVLIPLATTRYTAALSAGESGEYREAVSQGAAGAILNSIAGKSAGNLNGIRSELEFFIQVKTDRMNPADGIDYISVRLELTTGWYALVKRDNYKWYSDNSVEDHIEFLSRLMRALQRKLGGSDLDKLQAEKAELQRDYMSALDNNDLDGAKRIEGLIAEVDAKIAEEENDLYSQIADLQTQLDDLRNGNSGGGQNDDAIRDLTGLLDDLYGQRSGLLSDLDDLNANNGDGSNGEAIAGLEGDLSDLNNRISGLESDLDDLNRGNGGINDGAIRDLEAQLSLLNNGLSDNSVGNLVAGLRGNLLDAIDGDGNGLDDGIDALIGLLDPNYKIAFPALKDVYDAMLRKSERDGTDKFDGLIDKVEGAILDNRAAYDDSMRGDVDFDLLGRGFLGNLDGDNAIIFIMALVDYYDQTGSDEAYNLARFKTTNEFNSGNVYVWLKCNEPLGVYLPSKTVAKFSKMGYVWNRNRNQTVLTRGTAYYGFTAYSEMVIRSKDGSESEEMPLTAKFRADVYIPNVYTLQNFGCDGMYVPGTDYGVLTHDGFRATADELLGIFLRGY